MSGDTIRESSGNVFADLGLTDPVTHKLRAELVHKLDGVLKSSGLGPTAASRLIGMGQSDLSRLLRGGFREMSVERLLSMLSRLGCDVDVSVRWQGRLIGEVIRYEAVAA
ncbi:helix-turn-helix domain-containing protein [Sphingomonas sp. SUN019]|uniref:helix-turn-helix domain-containing protein n=1 Tax=Sphingomonas sp. SUN019 TaxID=2937788 RepID=UPI002164E4A2|nr:helix-turn-helix transcriptional regulator [Sphingomonas sp. SUN019]UVO52011.1 helix-turn-helix domain-containing protein [Sphingomonas sp. SUN019]